MEGKRPRILVIDDEPENVRLLEVKLRQEYEVDTVKSGLQALAFLKKAENNPDLILMDQMMPSMDGLMTFTAMQQQNLIKGVPVIMVTAYGSIENATHALRLGAYDFLEKPCTLTQLQQVAKRAMEHRRQLRELAALQGKPGQAADLPSRLVELEQLRADFLTMVIQDLREPLRLLSKTVELARDGFYGVWSEVQKPFLHQCARVQAFLTRLLLGGFAIFLSHEQHLEIVPVELHLLIKELSREMEQDTQEKGIRLQVKLPLEPVCGRTDPGKVSSMVRELLENAIEATQKGGQVSLELLTQPDGFQIRVSDTGGGIPEEEKRWLFTTFHALASGHPQRGQKVSLGLPLVRHYLDLLNGKIEVEGNSPSGSRFTLSLPYYNR